MTVTVYSIPSCPKCSAAKALLKRKGVSFEEADAKEKEQEMLEKLERNGIPADSAMMPVIDIEGNITQGFDREKIENALKEKGLIQ